jgi:DNA-binding GntR family transcriptional regulator
MIKRSTLRAQLASALRDEILAARLPAGSHFTVKEIAEQYGVSATPVREAMVDLAAQGLLDVEQHRGFRVHEYTVDDYRSMVKARAVVLDGLFHGFVEAEAVRTAEAATGAGSAPPPRPAFDTGVLASVRRRADAAVRAARAGDLDVLIGYDLRYWSELGGLVIGNPYICDFLDRLRVQCWVFSVPCLRRDGGIADRLWSGYRELVEAVEQRDPVEARRIVSEYHRHALKLAEGPAVRTAP